MDYELIENSVKAMDEFGHLYGSEIKIIERRDLEKLASGEKIAAFTVNDEYVVFLGVRRPVETKGE